MSLLAERAQRAKPHSIEICGICRYTYYYDCMCIVGSKVIAFAASAIFEIIALLQDCWQVESEFTLLARDFD